MLTFLYEVLKAIRVIFLTIHSCKFKQLVMWFFVCICIVYIDVNDVLFLLIKNIQDNFKMP